MDQETRHEKRETDITRIRQDDGTRTGERNSHEFGERRKQCLGSGFEKWAVMVLAHNDGD